MGRTIAWTSMNKHTKWLGKYMHTLPFPKPLCACRCTLMCVHTHSPAVLVVVVWTRAFYLHPGAWPEVDPSYNSLLLCSDPNLTRRQVKSKTCTPTYLHCAPCKQERVERQNTLGVTVSFTILTGSPSHHLGSSSSAFRMVNFSLRCLS